LFLYFLTTMEIPKIFLTILFSKIMFEENITYSKLFFNLDQYCINSKRINKFAGYFQSIDLGNRYVSKFRKKVR
jgi:hypothetical protein